MSAEWRDALSRLERLLDGLQHNWSGALASRARDLLESSDRLEECHDPDLRERAASLAGLAGECLLQQDRSLRASGLAAVQTAITGRGAEERLQAIAGGYAAAAAARLASLAGAQERRSLFQLAAGVGTGVLDGGRAWFASSPPARAVAGLNLRHALLESQCCAVWEALQLLLAEGNEATLATAERTALKPPRLVDWLPVVCRELHELLVNGGPAALAGSMRAAAGALFFMLSRLAGDHAARLPVLESYSQALQANMEAQAAVIRTGVQVLAALLRQLQQEQADALGGAEADSASGGRAAAGSSSGSGRITVGASGSGRHSCSSSAAAAGSSRGGGSSGGSGSGSCTPLPLALRVLETLNSTALQAGLASASSGRTSTSLQLFKAAAAAVRYTAALDGCPRQPAVYLLTQAAFCMDAIYDSQLAEDSPGGSDPQLAAAAWEVVQVWPAACASLRSALALQASELLPTADVMAGCFCGAVRLMRHVPAPADAQQLAAGSRAAEACLRLLPLLLPLAERQAAEPANSGPGGGSGQQGARRMAAECLYLWDQHVRRLAKVKLNQLVQTAGTEHAQEAATALLGLHAAACQLVHWVAGLEAQLAAALPGLTEQLQALCATHAAALLTLRDKPGGLDPDPRSAGLSELQALTAHSPPALLAQQPELVAEAQALLRSELEKTEASGDVDAVWKLVDFALLTADRYITRLLADGLVEEGLAAAERATRHNPLLGEQMPDPAVGRNLLRTVYTKAQVMVAAGRFTLGQIEQAAPGDPGGVSGQQHAAAIAAATDSLASAVSRFKPDPPSRLAVLQRYRRELLPPAVALAAALQAYWAEPAQQQEAQLELAQAAAARSCAYLRCSQLGLQGGPGAGERPGSLRCSGCRAVWYCGTACSHADWRAGHRRVCKALAAARQLEKEQRQQPDEGGGEQEQPQQEERREQQGGGQ